jgi:FkbM family methyltransferase
VIAVEPDERAYSSIQGNNVTLVKAVVAEESGVAEFFLRESPDQNSLLEEHPVGGGGGSPAPAIAPQDIEAISMDDMLPQGADFVKMDIEGGEVSALRGCRDVSRWADTVFLVECHDTFAEVTKELERLGKEVEHIKHPFPAHSGHCWALGK